MSFHSRVTTYEMTGAAGVPEEVPLGGYTKTQIEIAGRAAGNIGIKLKGQGGDVFVNAYPDPLSLDLSSDRGAIFPDSLAGLEFTADTLGPYTVTVTETLTT